MREQHVQMVAEFEPDPDLGAEVAALRLLLGMPPAADRQVLAGAIADALDRAQPDAAGVNPVQHRSQQGSEATG